MKILLLNFGYFLQIIGQEEQQIKTSAKNVEELYQEMSQKYLFKFKINQCRVAINDTVVQWTTILKEGDKVAFLTPYSGG